MLRTERTMSNVIRFPTERIKRRETKPRDSVVIPFRTQPRNRLELEAELFESWLDQVPEIFAPWKPMRTLPRK